MKILLPDTIALSPTLPEGVQHSVYDPRLPLPESDRDAEALVTWGVPGTEALRELGAALPRLRWVQSLSAGTDAEEAAGFGEGVVLTSGQGLHDLPVAEHALALILAATRRLDLMYLAQQEHHWSRELGGPQPLHPPDRLGTLLEAQVLIWGFGGIGQLLASYLATLGAHVHGVARSAGQRAGFPVAAPERLPELLAGSDILVMVLPATAETHHALDAELLAHLPADAWVVNVGRGATIDQEALVTSLREGRIGGAALDVTTPEPLPREAALWEAPNLILSPHAAGGRPVGAEELIEDNLQAFLAGRPLRNVVQR